MKAILVFWVACLVFCSLYTFVLPAWDALHARRGSDRKDTRAAATPNKGANRPQPTA